MDFDFSGMPVAEGLLWAQRHGYLEHGRTYDMAKVTHMAFNYLGVLGEAVFRAHARYEMKWPEGCRLAIELPLSTMFIVTDPRAKDGECVLKMTHGDAPEVSVRLST